MNHYFVKIETGEYEDYRCNHLFFWSKNEKEAWKKLCEEIDILNELNAIYYFKDNEFVGYITNKGVKENYKEFDENDDLTGFVTFQIIE